MQINQNQNINTELKIKNLNSSVKPVENVSESFQNEEVNPSFCQDENKIKDLNSESKAETNIPFVEEPKSETSKYSVAVEKVVAQLRKASTPEEKGKILNSFKNSLNFTKTEPNMGMLGDGIGVFSVTTRYENPRLRPFIKHAKNGISEANKSENKSDVEMYKQIIKTVKEARKERWKDDSPPDRYSLFKM